jgi:hypothetical protein
MLMLLLLGLLITQSPVVLERLQLGLFIPRLLLGFSFRVIFQWPVKVSFMIF